MSKGTKIVILITLGIVVIPNVCLIYEKRKFRKRAESLRMPEFAPLKETRIKVTFPFENYIPTTYQEKYGSDGLPD